MINVSQEVRDCLGFRLLSAIFGRGFPTNLAKKNQVKHDQQTLF